MSRPVITVFGASRSRPGDGHYEAGERCGRLLAEAGFSVATGGYGGLMEAVSRGAQAAGGAAVGVTAPSVFPDRPGANAFVTEELRAASLVERIHQLTELSVASIALHGSLGTLTELVVAWNVAFVARLGETSPKPVVAVGPQWRSVVEALAAAVDTDGSLVTCVDTVDEAVAAVRRRVAPA